MRGITLGVVFMSLSLGGSLVAAEPISTAPGPAGTVLGRVARPPANHPNAVAQSRVIYLNRGATILYPDVDDSRANTSSIIPYAVQVPGWATDDQTWGDFVDCFREVWSRFDVEITDVDPGNVDHIEALVGGSPEDAGFPSGYGGVSPFTEDCGIIEDSIVFVFADVFPQDARLICEVASQEVAHSYGLDHEMNASDPMTYLDRTGDREFQDKTVSCGEYSNRLCGIGGSVCRNNQNSVALLKARVGEADLIAPTIEITAPADGATVAPGFEIDAAASDNKQVVSATVTVDGQVLDTTDTAGPYAWPTAKDLADGPHEITVMASDGKNTETTTVHITVKADAQGSGDGGSDMGSGSNMNPTGGGDDDDPSGGGGTSSGCAAGGNGGLGLGLGLGLAFIASRRARRARG